MLQVPVRPPSSQPGTCPSLPPGLAAIAGALGSAAPPLAAPLHQPLLHVAPAGRCHPSLLYTLARPPSASVNAKRLSPTGPVPVLTAVSNVPSLALSSGHLAALTVPWALGVFSPSAGRVNSRFLPPSLGQQVPRPECVMSALCRLDAGASPQTAEWGGAFWWEQAIRRGQVTGHVTRQVPGRAEPHPA